jgi:hypothetical protein
MNQPDKTRKNYDRLWKIISLFDKLNASYAKFYNPSAHLAVTKYSSLHRESYFQAINS